MSRQVLTIGHSNHSAEQFVHLLKLTGVEVVVDVRTHPASSFSPQFSRAPLQALVNKNGVRYVFLGKELGGRPSDRSLYDDEGHVRYDRVATTSEFRQGLDRLIKGIEQFRVAIMCGEEDPMYCHRRLLVGRVLAQAGIGLGHIRADGHTESESLLAERELQTTGDQLDLFDSDGVKSWRSIRSVLPVEARRASSRL
jgi:uncharacterized protein (DUF488 family)